MKLEIEYWQGQDSAEPVKEARSGSSRGWVREMDPRPAVDELSGDKKGCLVLLRCDVNEQRRG